MDTIEFRLSASSKFGDEISTAVAEIFINGHCLREKFFIDPASIPVAELYKNLSAKCKTDSVPILGCGVPEFFPVSVTVEVGADTVTWKNFVLPHKDSQKRRVCQKLLLRQMFGRPVAHACKIF